MGRRFCFGYSIIISAYMHPSQTTIYKCNRDTGDGICDCSDVVGEFEVACAAVCVSVIAEKEAAGRRFV